MEKFRKRNTVLIDYDSIFRQNTLRDLNSNVFCGPLKEKRGTHVKFSFETIALNDLCALHCQILH